MRTKRKISGNEHFIDYRELLIVNELVTEKQLCIAQEEQKRTKGSLKDILIDIGFLQEEKLVNCLIETFNYKSFDAGIVHNNSLDLITFFPSNVAYQHSVMPIKFDQKNKIIHAVFSDPLDIKAQDIVQNEFNAEKIEYYVATKRNILHALDKAYGTSSSYNSATSNVSYLGNYNGINGKDFVQSIIDDAVKMHASDIHFEPKHKIFTIKLRIGGELTEYKICHIDEWAITLSRLKIISAMNIAETRLPQTGRFSSHIAGRNVDFRASCHPTSGGESFVIRILDKLSSFLTLDEIGFNKSQTKQIKNQLIKPYGIIIVTGPTGSGKTTSLYSMIDHINYSKSNIMTLEDPIEYNLNGIRQTQINLEKNFDFADGVKSILRQDPDVILIGEIRDEQTAKMALRASMTGHLVLTTLHANNALSAVNRLIDLGINPKNLSGNINCIISQRLVKTTKAQTMSQRIPVAEILEVTPELDALFIAQAPMHELYNHAVQHGYISMQEQARQLINDGLTTAEFVKKVLPL